MGDLIKEMFVRGGILALIATIFGAAYVLVKTLVAAIDSDRLRSETRMSAAEKRARLIFEIARFQVVRQGARATLRMSMRNIGRSDAADIWMRFGVEAVWPPSFRPRAEWFPLLRAGHDEAVQINLGVQSQANARVGVLIELSYRDYGEVERREWYGYRFEVARPSTAVTFRVGTLTRMFRFWRLRGWRL